MFSVKGYIILLSNMKYFSNPSGIPTPNITHIPTLTVTHIVTPIPTPNVTHNITPNANTRWRRCGGTWNTTGSENPTKGKGKEKFGQKNGKQTWMVLLLLESDFKRRWGVGNFLHCNTRVPNGFGVGLIGIKSMTFRKIHVSQCAQEEEVMLWPTKWRIMYMEDCHDVTHRWSWRNKGCSLSPWSCRVSFVFKSHKLDFRIHYQPLSSSNP